MTTLCLMENVKKTFSIGDDVSVEVLKGIDLAVEEGEFIAIMGTSGSGKSTLMNLIGCLDVPTSGRYLLAGREVLGLQDDDLSELRNAHIGFVFQSFYLLPYATVLENVLLPTLYRESKASCSQKAGGHVEKHAVELLHLVGLEKRMNFRPNRLSGGEQQRTALCRALMNDPEIILADEPTGQLDSKTASEIMNLLAEMNKKGKTVILVTHDAAIASSASRIIRIKDGVIINE